MIINKDTIHIETDYMWEHAGYEFGEDQAYVDYPIRFPTVTFALRDTHELNMIADKMRKAAGKMPMFDYSTECDLDGWYNFYVGINTYTNTHVDNYIWFVVSNGQDDDSEQIYHIDINEDEQRNIYNVLDEQCRELYDESCLDILMEAEKEILMQ